MIYLGLGIVFVGVWWGLWYLVRVVWLYCVILIVDLIFSWFGKFVGLVVLVMLIVVVVVMFYIVL